jgi:hypothetical protein
MFIVKKKWIIGLLGVAAAASITGCVVGVRGPGVGLEVPVFPPGVLVETPSVVPAPNYAWVGGYWSWNGAWVWVPGRWVVPPRPGVHWTAGYWYRGPGGGWVWRAGYWQ